MLYNIVMHKSKPSKNNLGFTVAAKMNSNSLSFSLQIPSVEVASYEGETDVLKIIQVLRENPSIQFFYLTHALPKRSTKYHYYNLR